MTLQVNGVLHKHLGHQCIHVHRPTSPHHDAGKHRVCVVLDEVQLSFSPARESDQQSMQRNQISAVTSLCNRREGDLRHVFEPNLELPRLVGDHIPELPKVPACPWHPSLCHLQMGPLPPPSSLSLLLAKLDGVQPCLREQRLD